MKLSKEELQFIDQHLKDRKVENWDVRYEILDHIACLVESKMEEGSSFDEAFAEVKMTFTFRYLLKMQQEKEKAIRRKFRKSFINEFKKGLISVSFLSKVLFLVVLTIVFYKYVSIQLIIATGIVLLYSPVFVQITAMIKNYKLYGKSMLLSNAWLQLLGIPSMLMLPINLKGDVIMGKYGLVILIVVLCLIPVSLTWNSLLLKEMKKLKEQYFLIYE